MEDKIKRDKAEFDRRMKNDQEAAQAMLDLERMFIDITLEDENPNSFIRKWYHHLPEMVFNPFLQETASSTFSYPSTHPLLSQTNHGKQLYRCFLDCLKQRSLPPIKENFINAAITQPFLGFTNNALLSFKSQLKGYRDLRWFSADFIHEKGYQLYHDAEPVELCYWSLTFHQQPILLDEAFDRVDRNHAQGDQIMCESTCYTVYNAEEIIQLRRYMRTVPLPFSADEKVRKCECIIGGLGVSLAYNGETAGEDNYDRETDRITIFLPLLSSERHCVSLIHQACRSTAHKERLNRSLPQWQEDMCCMLAAVTLCDRIQLDERPILSTETAKRWAKLLAENSESISTIFRETKRIIDYLMELYPDIGDKSLSDVDISSSLQDRIANARAKKEGDAL